MENFLRGFIAVVFSLTLAVVCFAAGFLTNVYAPQSTEGGTFAPTDDVATPSEPPANWSLFSEAVGWMEREFYGDLPQDDQAISWAAIRGVLNRLSDRNTILVEPVAADREQELFDGEFGGVGAQVNTNEEGYLVIVAPIDGTPAARADLRANDIILQVDETEIIGMTTDEAVQLIRGPVGTEVRLLILRGGEEFEVTLTREKIPDPTIASAMIEETDIGYIRMSFFSERTHGELVEAIEELRGQGAQKFVLDLRNNPGGLLSSAIATTSTFVGEGVVAYQQFNDGSRQELFAEGNPIAPDEPMVVLINEGSASASEILAGALQAYNRATLIGTQSYGKGTVQIPYELSDGSSLHVTIAHWLTPSEVDLSSEGLTPDRLVAITEEDREAGVDPQLEAAIELLNEVTP
jgi:carboxyl-terminal processing protease